MKKLGNKSLSTTLHVAVKILWWAEWIAGSICLIVMGLAAHIRKGFALQIPINYSATTIGQIYPNAKNGSLGILNVTEGLLSVHIAANWQNITMMLIGYGLFFAVVVTITYQLKMILKSFSQDEPFQILNLSRIKKIASILIAYSLVQWLFVVTVNHILISYFRFNHLDLTYGFNTSCLLAGVTLFMAEGVFKAGLLLEEEKQLTI